MPGAPTPAPGERCDRFDTRDGIFIREPGVPDKLVYTLIVDVNWCFTDFDGDNVNQGIVTRFSVTSRAVRANPGDSRLTTLTETTTTSTSPLRLPTLADVETVYFRGCGDRFNAASCQNFEHELEITVTGNGRASTVGRLFRINGPLPIIT
jgi:hypothetical protein